MKTKLNTGHPLILFIRVLLLLPFVPIMKGGEQKELIQRALNELRADEQLKEMEMTLAFFASFVMQTTLIKQIMRWDMVVLQQSPWY